MQVKKQLPMSVRLTSADKKRLEAQAKILEVPAAEALRTGTKVGLLILTQLRTDAKKDPKAKGLLSYLLKSVSVKTKVKK